MFIFDSYSCRRGKGTHRALNRFHDFGRQVSQNHTRTVWILKADIKKFFASIKHSILLDALSAKIKDPDTIWLLTKIIASFHTPNSSGRGLPLGNLTSQLFVNIYMNKFDHFLKHQLKVRHYIRYADDFVIFQERRNYLEKILPQVATYLEDCLQLSLHPNKIFIKTLASGVDFLGWVHFENHRTLRTSTKRRMLKKLTINQKEESIASYCGLLSHGNTYKLQQRIANEFQLNLVKDDKE